MDLVSTTQISTETVKNTQFDAFVGANGYEGRATNALRFLQLNEIDQKIAFAFTDRKTHFRTINDSIFSRAGTTLVEADGDSGNIVRKTFISLVDNCKAERIRIFIDYSSMTRTWYGAIIAALSAINCKRRIECYFSYSPSVFEYPHPPTPNRTAGPIPGFCGLDALDRPSALIVGLGYEKDRALGLFEYIDPAVCFAFITDPPLDQRYLEILKANNASFLRLIGLDNQYLHSLTDLQRVSTLLLSLIWGLKDQYRVILAPMGVKPFALMCLLLAIRYPELDVWRITSGTKGSPHSREALGEIHVLRAVFDSV